MAWADAYCVFAVEKFFFVKVGEFVIAALIGFRSKINPSINFNFSPVLRQTFDIFSLSFKFHHISSWNNHISDQRNL